MGILALVVDNQVVIKGRDSKRKREFKQIGLQLVVNQPMGFIFRDAMKGAARRKAEQANMARVENERIAAQLKRGK